MRLLIFAVALASVATAVAAADLKVTVSDPEQVAAIDWMRDQHNATLPAITSADVVANAVAALVDGWVRAKREADMAPLDAARKKCVDAGDCADAEKVTK